MNNVNLTNPRNKLWPLQFIGNKLFMAFMDNLPLFFTHACSCTTAEIESSVVGLLLRQRKQFRRSSKLNFVRRDDGVGVSFVFLCIAIRFEKLLHFFQMALFILQKSKELGLGQKIL